MNTNHDYSPTIYVGEKETQHIYCNQIHIGAIQRSKSGYWTPNYGEYPLTGELPAMTEGRFTLIEAIQWIENKHKCEKN